MELGPVRPDLTPFLNEEASDGSSLRSSLDNEFYQSQGCEFSIYDDKQSEQSRDAAGSNRSFDASTWRAGLGNCNGLAQHLKVAEKPPR